MSPTATTGPVIYGEVLFDRFPDGNERLGGAPFNVAWHLQSFGAQPLFISRVGEDPLGETIQQAMSDHGMRLDGLQHDPHHPTGSVEVTITDDEPSYDIVNDRAYDHIALGELPRIVDIPLLYHGSLALRGAESRTTLEAFAQQQHPPRFVDINLRAPWWRSEQIEQLCGAARWLKLNEDELRQIQRSTSPIEEAASQLVDDYLLEALIVTRGAEGVTLFRQGQPPVTRRPTTEERVIDTVGAGDAFASVMLLGLLREWPLVETLDRAQAFASRLVTIRGAIPDGPAFYQPFLDRWAL